MQKQKFYITTSSNKTHIVIGFWGLKIKLRKRHNNGIYLIRDGKRRKVRSIKGLKVKFLGNNSKVEIETDPKIKFINTEIILGTDCRFTIGKSKHFVKDVIFNLTARNSSIKIGKDFSFCGGFIINGDEDSLKIKIGDDCQFSSFVYLRASDGHTIYDLNTKKILNEPEKTSVNIGNHVWLCNKVTILKNSSIADNTIVGNSTVVNKKFKEENCVIAGMPARVVKTNVNWDRAHTHDFEQNF